MQRFRCKLTRPVKCHFRQPYAALHLGSVTYYPLWKSPPPRFLPTTTPTNSVSVKIESLFAQSPAPPPPPPPLGQILDPPVVPISVYKENDLVSLTLKSLTSLNIVQCLILNYSLLITVGVSCATQGLQQSQVVGSINCKIRVLDEVESTLEEILCDVTVCDYI